MSTANVTALHGWHHDDYDEAIQQIKTHLGDISDLEVFGRQVVVAVYVRPSKNAAGIYQTAKAQQEDFWQGKAVLVLKCGPDAFSGSEEYARAMFGDKPPPQPDDWVFLRASDGMPINLCGDDAKRVQGKTFGGEMVDIFPWDGWPCRIVSDESIIGRINKPHSLV
jgi:hypothetical protein